MKVLNQAETAQVIAEMVNGKAEVVYARADNHEGAEYVYCTVKVSDPLKAFAHLFDITDNQQLKEGT
jgi:hypothetical protein